MIDAKFGVLAAWLHKCSCNVAVYVYRSRVAKCEHIIKQPREGKVIDQFFYILQEYTAKCFIRIRARLERESYAHTHHLRACVACMAVTK